MRLIDANALIISLAKDRSALVNNHVPHGELRRIDETIWKVVEAPTISAVPVVRCRECVWWKGRQVQLADGTCRDYLPDEPWSVTLSVGINVGSHCTKHGFDDESGSWFWAQPDDYCSRGERKEDKG